MAITSVNNQAQTAPAHLPTNQSALAMVTTLFFLWGFMTALNDILIPHLKSIFDLNYTEVMLVQFCFFSAYFVFSLPSGKVIEWIGYKYAMVVGLLTMGLGSFLFIPAASLPSYPLFLAALIVLAAGMTILQVSANPYVAVLGPPETASSRLNLTQAFNSLGTTIAPYLGGVIILSATPNADVVKSLTGEALHAFRVQQASSVKLPYLGLGLIAVVLALVIAGFKLPAIESAVHHKGEATGSVWSYPHLWMGAIGIFVYVGAEVTIGSLLINYLTQPNIGDISPVKAATLVGFCYWGGAMVGRFIGSAILQKVRTSLVLGTAAVVAFCLVCTSMLTFGHVAMWSLILVGLFNSIMFPSIFTSGIAELGPMTSKGSSLLIMAIVGGAIIPELSGKIADVVGIHHSFILAALCYLYIAYYGYKGSKPMGPGITEPIKA
ncbi:MAG TPA: sugar MFS transporter [Terriglobales bacterium]|nr:sugar MFS transporter [Terriglobales bacterium]